MVGRTPPDPPRLFHAIDYVKTIKTIAGTFYWLLHNEGAAVMTAPVVDSAAAAAAAAAEEEVGFVPPTAAAIAAAAACAVPTVAAVKDTPSVLAECNARWGCTC
jgi:uncharacterized protein (DUF2126 family)